MTDDSTETDYFGLILAYFPFVIIFLGVVFNPISFLIFRFNKHLKKMSSMMILSFVVVVN